MTMTAMNDRQMGNGNGLAVQQPQELVAVDSSPFSNLLDTTKFEHLWRVAEVFARSKLVPVHFQGKVEDCFVAAQMAIRLGVDPFMFMQNTYVTQGKPGMEGKLAIALINTSGLFAGPILFQYSGDGDDYGCIAYAKLKGTGERVEGPRVTIAIAKSEGWYGRNAKWKSVPELMLMYRAGSWFGRAVCPERLMGMQTVDELKDIDGEIQNAGAQTKQARLNARVVSAAVTSKALDDGRTLEVDHDAAANADAQDAYTESPEGPNVDGSDAQPPEDSGPDVSTWAATQMSMAEAAMDAGEIDLPELERRTSSWLLIQGLRGKGDKTSQAQRLELVAAVRANKLGPDGKITA